MPSKTSKSLASRVPLDIYYRLVEDASQKGITLSDYVCGIIYNYYNVNEKGSNGQQDSQRIDEYKLRTRKAFTAAVELAVSEYGAEGERLVEAFNANMD